MYVKIVSILLPIMHMSAVEIMSRDCPERFGADTMHGCR